MNSTPKIIEVITGQYTKTISKDDLNQVAIILKMIHNDPLAVYSKHPEAEIIKMVDRFRNMLFLEGQLMDNNCMVQIAYDLDQYITNGSFQVLDDVVIHIRKIAKSKNMLCENNRITDKNDVFRKWEWYNHFKNATKNFTDLNGWNSLTIKN